MPKISTKPNLFIVGAPKCGTSSMAHYLSQHPDVFMARREQNYFGSDLFRTVEFPFGRSRRTIKEYLGHFEGAESFKIRGEKSVAYLHSTQAAFEIAEFSPDAKIIIMLRNPTDFIFSWHAQLVYSGNEPIADLRHALGAEPQRRNGLNMPANVDIGSKLYYRQIADFAPNVLRYFDVFGRDRVLIILLEDMTRDPHAVYHQTKTFLGIDSGFDPVFDVINRRKSVRLRFVADLVRRPHPIVRRAARILVPSTTVRDRLGQFILRTANARKVDSGDVDLAIRGELAEEFEPRIQALSDVIRRDLSHWTVREAANH